MIPTMPAQCATCIFRPGNLMHLKEGRLAEIQAYLLRGTSHECHSVPPKGRRRRYACRGGRDFQLQCWARMGIIREPTDEALADAMRRAGAGSGHDGTESDITTT